MRNKVQRIFKKGYVDDNTDMTLMIQWIDYWNWVTNLQFMGFSRNGKEMLSAHLCRISHASRWALVAFHHLWAWQYRYTTPSTMWIPRLAWFTFPGSKYDCMIAGSWLPFASICCRIVLVKPFFIVKTSSLPGWIVSLTLFLTFPISLERTLHPGALECLQVSISFRVYEENWFHDTFRLFFGHWQRGSRVWRFWRG